MKYFCILAIVHNRTTIVYHSVMQNLTTKYNILLSFVLLLFAQACDGTKQKTEAIAGPIPATDYVTIDEGQFKVNGKTWFPVMLNYKADFKKCGDSLEVVPINYYYGENIEEHFDTIADWGFNAVRICLDIIGKSDDTASMHNATRRMIEKADNAGLRVMLLIKAPFEPYWESYTKGLLRHLKDMPALWAYDFMNEPLYFDPEPNRSKSDAVRIATQWRDMVRTYAPHQLFTIATAEPIEVFEWDPSILPVDFIQMHTYHPLRVESEMWWYANYCDKPWMVGETGLPADGDSVPYEWQNAFLTETFLYAKALGAIGYGWWEFQDCPTGMNFEAQYTGMRDTQGRRKPCVSLIQHASKAFPIDSTRAKRPVNYLNMLAYKNLSVSGNITDTKGEAIEGAVIRGWNKDWSVGMNTYSDSNGRFQLISNDICEHFEISAPGYSKQKIDATPNYPDNMILPDRNREYQSIDYRTFMPNNGILPNDSTLFHPHEAVNATIGTIILEPLR